MKKEEHLYRKPINEKASKKIKCSARPTLSKRKVASPLVLSLFLTVCLSLSNS